MTLTTTPPDRIAGLVDGARATFRSGRTRPLAWRRAAVARRQELLGEHEDRLLAALAADLGKPPLEAWITEIGFCRSDIPTRPPISSTGARPERVASTVTFQPGRSHIHRDPLGVVAV